MENQVNWETHSLFLPDLACESRPDSLYNKEVSDVFKKKREEKTSNHWKYSVDSGMLSMNEL